MPRPRAFDNDAVLSRAMETFWSQGYEATSLDDLCAAMGLSRSSLYQAFGSKSALLYTVLDHYAAQSAERVEKHFSETRPVGRAVSEFFENFIDDALVGNGRRGCLLGNCAAELGVSDPEAACRIAAGLGRIESVFETAFERARAAGELCGDADPKALSRFMTASVQGLRLMAKANPDRGALEDVARGIRAGLGC